MLTGIFSFSGFVPVQNSCEETAGQRRKGHSCSNRLRREHRPSGESGRLNSCSNEAYDLGKPGEGRPAQKGWEMICVLTQGFKITQLSEFEPRDYVFRLAFWCGASSQFTIPCSLQTLHWGILEGFWPWLTFHWPVSLGAEPTSAELHFCCNHFRQPIILAYFFPVEI